MSAQANLRRGLATLRDGRRLAYLEVGPADGVLVLYLHGAIGSPQCVCPELEALVGELRVRYVMVSRPGFGASDPLAGRTLLAFAADVAELADQLGCERFTIVGVSAGGPYALACAHALPERVVAAAVVSSMSGSGAVDCLPGLAPGARMGLRALRRWPRASSGIGDGLLGIARRHPRLVARVMLAGAAPADRRQLAESEVRELAATRFLAAARGGVGGMIDDYLLCARPWGFAPADVRGRVHLWHGIQDQLVPIDHARQMAAVLPDVRTAFDPAEGHFFYRRRLREILGELVAAAHEAEPRARAAQRVAA